MGSMEYGQDQAHADFKFPENMPSTSETIEQPASKVVDLQTGVETISRDLEQKIDIETITDEQLAKFNEKLHQDWTEVNTLLTTKLDVTVRQQEKFAELKNDLVENFLAPYSIVNSEESSPYAHTEDEIAEKAVLSQQARDLLTEKFTAFAQNFKQDGEPLKKLAELTEEQKLNPENIRKLAEQIGQELQDSVTKLEHQKHLSEEGVINAKGLTKSSKFHNSTQEEADELLFLHTNLTKQITDLDNGTWKQTRRRQE